MERLVTQIIDTIITFGFNHQLIFMTLLGGIFPTLVWIIFWVYEGECDESPDPETGVTYLCEPEPKWLLAATFFAGGLSVIIVLLLEDLVKPFFKGTDLIIVWATIEELIKYLVFWFIDYKSGKISEPADALVYLSITALGFSAIENSLFLYKSLSQGDLSGALLGQNYRFLGASILHVLCSGFIGICIGYTYFGGLLSRSLATIFGILGAISLHSAFNYFIIMDSSASGLHVPAIIWSIGIIFLALIEGLRFLAKQHKRDKCEY
jgi:RsiW-degrading membrane proteinase PrsW (M82 family)